MSTKTALKIQNKYIQYSKKMASRVAIFWMIYRIANFAVVLFRPEAAKYLVDLSSGVDMIMIVNMGVYTGNSISEKGFIAFGKRKSLYSTDEDNEEDDKEDDNNG